MSESFVESLKHERKYLMVFIPAIYVLMSTLHFIPHTTRVSVKKQVSLLLENMLTTFLFKVVGFESTLEINKNNDN